MLAWKRITLVSAVLLLDIGAFLILFIQSLHFSDETDLLEDEAYQRFELGVSLGWWLWWGINAAMLVVVMYWAFKQSVAVRQQNS